MRMTWQRLSARAAGTQPDGPYEGVPGHLKYPLIGWLRECFGLEGIKTTAQEPLIRTIAIRFRETVPMNVNLRAFAQSLIVEAAGGDDSHDVREEDEDRVTNHEYFLDLIDATLDLIGSGTNRWYELNTLLIEGESVWRVADDRRSLARVVSDEAKATFDVATAVGDEITTHIREAWSNAFGRKGDPSDAWEHAVKAMEALFIPVVVPNQTKPNLGHAVGQLRSQGHLWKLVLPGKELDHDVAPLVGMLDLIWPNVDRHPGVSTTRPPTPEESRAAVTLAATIVQWHRDGWVVQRR